MLRVFAALATFLVVGPLPAADWPSFRGNLQNTGATSQSFTSPLKPAWSYDTHGTGIISSAAIVKGIAYVGMRDTPGTTPISGRAGAVQVVNRGALLAVDAASGRFRWRFSHVNGTPIGWVDSSPTVAGDRVYFTCRDGYFYCLDTSGRFMWRLHTGGMDDSSPAVDGGVAYFGSGYPNTVFLAVDLATHKVRWRVSSAYPQKGRAAGFAYSSPALADERLIIGANNGVFACLSRTGGAVLWRFPTDGTIDFFAPAVADGRVFAAAGDYDPVFRALSLSSGHEAWKFRAPGSHNYISSPAAAGGQVFLAMGTNQQRLYALDAATGVQQWSFPLGTSSIQPFISSPVVAGGLVFIGSGPPESGSDGGALYALDAKTRDVRWKYDVHAAIVASPAVAEGRVIVGALNGVLYAFKSGGPG